MYFTTKDFHCLRAWPTICCVYYFGNIFYIIITAIEQFYCIRNWAVLRFTNLLCYTKYGKFFDPPLSGYSYYFINVILFFQLHNNIKFNWQNHDTMALPRKLLLALIDLNMRFHLFPVQFNNNYYCRKYTNNNNFHGIF